MVQRGILIANLRDLQDSQNEEEEEEEARVSSHLFIYLMNLLSPVLGA